MAASSAPVVSLSFFRFLGFGHKWWAFTQMQLAKAELRKLKGSHFYKIMGSGGGSGYSIRPDFSVYALLICWENREAFENFRRENPLHHSYCKKSEEELCFLLKACSGHGSWGGDNPFLPYSPKTAAPVAVLTRASIKPSMLPHFWKYVPSVSRNLEGRQGLCFSKGMGEWPLVELVTFSVWENEEVMKQFAYREKEHAEVVRKTRSRKWFSEELFVRFEILKKVGKWSTKQDLPSGEK